MRSLGGSMDRVKHQLATRMTGWKARSAIAFLLLLVVVGVVLGARVKHHIALVDAGIQAAEEAIEDPSLLGREDLADLQRLIHEGEKAILALRRETAPAFWMAPVLRHMPVYGGDIEQGAAVLGYGLHLVRAADLTLRGLEPSAATIREGMPLDELLGDVASKLEEGHQLFLTASQEVVQAREIRSSIAKARLSSGARHRLERGDALAGRLDTLTILGLRGPSAIATLMRLRNQVFVLQEQFQGLQDEGLTSQSLQALDAILGTLEPETLQLAEQIPDISPLAPYLGVDPEEIDANVTLVLDFLRVARRVLTDLRPVVVSLENGTALGTVDEMLKGAKTTFQEALELLDQVEEMGAENPLLQNIFPMGQDLDSYVLLLRQSVEAALEGPDLFQRFFALQGQAEEFNSLIESIQSVEGGLDLVELEESARTSEELLIQLQDEVEKSELSLRLLGLDDEEILANLSFYTRLLQAARFTAEGLQPLNEVSRQDVSPEDPYAALRAALEEGTASFREASLRLTLLREMQTDIQPSRLLQPFLPSEEDVDRGLRILEVAVKVGLETPELLDLTGMAAQQYEALTETLSTSLTDPAQLVLGDLGVYQGPVQEGLSNIQEARALLGELLIELRDAGLGLGVGATLEDLDKILEAAQSGFSAVSLSLDAAESLSKITEPGVFSTEFADTVQQAIPTAIDQISDAREQVQQGLNAVAPLTSRSSPAFLRSVGTDMNEKLESLSSALERAEDSLEVMRYFLGLDSTRTFIVLGQDDQELRPTGGFIGAVVEVLVTHGEVEIVQFNNSYDIDPPRYKDIPVGPPAFWKYMAGQPGLLTFRDSNWWPDFPTSAEMAIGFYELTQPSTLNGVIAIDTRVLAGLIDILGGVYIPGWEGRVDGATARDVSSGVLPYSCQPESNSNVPNRCFSEDIINALLAGFQHSTNSVQVARLIMEILEEKHILVYSRDSELQEKLGLLNWDGHLREPQEDYLAVFDWTAYSKAYDNIERSLLYDVYISADGTAEAELVVRYVNNAENRGPCFQFGGNYRSCYWNYLRVFVPPGAKMLDVPHFPLSENTLYGYNAQLGGRDVRGENTFEIAHTDSHTELAAFFLVNGGESMELEFRYSLPDRVVTRTASGERQYRLTIQKQPGTIGDEFVVRVHLPEGSTVVATSETAVIDGGVISFQLSLNTDREVSVGFSLPGQV